MLLFYERMCMIKIGKTSDDRVDIIEFNKSDTIMVCVFNWLLSSNGSKQSQMIFNSAA